MESIDTKKAWTWCAMLLVITAFVYGPVVTYDFVNWDDDIYVYENPLVLAGLTSDGVRWAFTEFYRGYWLPVTWLSYMVDTEIFGTGAGGYHFTNVVLHLVNIALLFGLLYKMTRRVFPCLFVAAIFALHPLHIESVAWITERKDVLSAMFWLLATWAYVRYTQQPGWRRYLPVFLFMALGLMTKPMLVTLPFTLLLLDVWPLGRVKFDKTEETKTLILPLIREKIPLFILVLVACAMTILTQTHSGSIAPLSESSLKFRAILVPLGYTFYLGKFIWPVGLSAIYPVEKFLAVGNATVAFVVLGALSVELVRHYKTRPYLAVGWFWFLGTLVPVIGFVQVGSVHVADRFSYIPLIGLSIPIAWGLADLIAARPSLKKPVCALAGLAVVAWVTLTLIQLPHWKNGVTLLSRTVAVTENNWRGHNNLGRAYEVRGKLDQALEQYRKTVEINPRYAIGRNNLGNILKALGRHEEAQEQYRKAAKFEKDPVTALMNQAMALVEAGNLEEALANFQKVVQANPRSADAHNGIGIVYANMRNFNKAEEHFRESLRLIPGYAPARDNLKRLAGDQ